MGAVPQSRAGKPHHPRVRRCPGLASTPESVARAARDFHELVVRRSDSRVPFGDRRPYSRGWFRPGRDRAERAGDGDCRRAHSHAGAANRGRSVAKIGSLVTATPRFAELGLMPYVWLVFLVYLFISPILGNADWFEWTCTIGSIVVFLPLYFAQFAQRHGRPRRAFALNVAIALMGLMLLPVNPGANTYIVYSAAGAAFALRPRAAVQYLIVLSAMAAMAMFLLPPEWRYWMGLPTILLVATIGGLNIYQAERLRQDAKLRRVQEDVEEMAKVAERERIGRDLHDLLGHTLSVITLKSELASKLADIDPKRAAEEIREVERVSRETLTEVRRAVEGYGQHGLKGELRNAERALDAAGVRLDI